MSYTPPTIAEQGGLRVHLTAMGVDYDEFRQLRTDWGDDRGRYKAIAKRLSRGRKSPISPRTIAAWFKVDDTERDAG